MTPAFAFDAPVALGGYAWWYLDAMSDDGQHGLAIIAFIGSVFSPYYARARRRGGGHADPSDHCALNVVLYTGRGSESAAAWAMTERSKAAVQRTHATLRIGPSQVVWNGSSLDVHIDEVTVPWLSRLRGVVRLHPVAMPTQSYALDEAGNHQWRPIAPFARVEVELQQPALRWSGIGYLDTNRGQRPLAQDFMYWNWSRAALSSDRSAVLYDVTRNDGSSKSLALAFGSNGQVQDFEPPPAAWLPNTAWHLTPAARSQATGGARIERVLEDGPFYARSILGTRLFGENVTAVHEHVSLTRWKQPVVQMMLPFRMPRRG